jgi:fibronectin-binding autotransporter adhesin
VDGSLILDGILQVTELAGFGDGTYRLFDYTGTLTDNQLDLESAFLAAHPGSFIDVSTANQVNLVVLPEPASAVLLLGGIAGLLGGRCQSGHRRPGSRKS